MKKCLLVLGLLAICAQTAQAQAVQCPQTQTVQVPATIKMPVQPACPVCQPVVVCPAVPVCPAAPVQTNPCPKTCDPCAPIAAPTGFAVPIEQPQPGWFNRFRGWFDFS